MSPGYNLIFEVGSHRVSPIPGRTFRQHLLRPLYGHLFAFRDEASKFDRRVLKGRGCLIVYASSHYHVLRGREVRVNRFDLRAVLGRLPERPLPLQLGLVPR